MTPFCGIELRHPVINASGCFDAIAARGVFGDFELPFSAYVSKTITLAPREGNPPPRLWETPAGRSCSRYPASPRLGSPIELIIPAGVSHSRGGVLP